MRKDYEKLFSHLKPAEPSVGLFDRIIFAIKKEQELRKTRRLVFGFFALLIITLIIISFSWTLLVEQVRSSGVVYFISAAISDFGTFLASWQDFSLAILESLPITGIVAFTISIGLALFTLRLFLYKKRLLLRYLMHSIPGIAFS